MRKRPCEAGLRIGFFIRAHWMATVRLESLARFCQCSGVARAVAACYADVVMRCREQLLRDPSGFLAKPYRCNHERFDQLSACGRATASGVEVMRRLDKLNRLLKSYQPDMVQ